MPGQAASDREDSKPPEARWLERDLPGAPRVLTVGTMLISMITLGMIGLVVRVAQLQFRPPQPIAELIDTQRSTQALRGRRGQLLDRTGRVLAITRPATTLFIDPHLIVDPNTFAERVGYGFDYDPAWVEMTVAQRPGSRYVVIDPHLTDARLSMLEAAALPPGLATQTQLVRDYPHASLAGQLLGFVGTDGDGLEGLERLYNGRLAGTPGKLAYLRDARHQPLWIDQATYEAPTDGKAVRLSLDVTIQAIAEAQLARACDEFGAQAGQIVIMKPQTGEILAMANYPFFDPGDFRTAAKDLHRNRCVTDVFEPGSIFKPFVWAAALQQNAARPDEMFDCTTAGVWRTPGGRRLHDAHPQGQLTWDGVLVKSSNIGMAQVGIRVGDKRLYEAVRAFGFGDPTGSGLPGEVAGIVTPRNKWTHYSVTSVPMGQEIAVTPLQITRAFCTIANGGHLVTPTMLLRQDDHDQNHVALLERVLSQAVADHTRSVLRRVVTEGTGRKANSKIYELFGKTGTAQIADRVNGGYLPDQYVSSFICGAPVDQPRIVVGCFIHQPDRSKGHYGGTVAAPAAMRAVEQTLLYLGVPTQTTASGSEPRLVQIIDD